MAPIRSLLAFVLTLQFAVQIFAAETNVFREAGIPSPDREWLGFDYSLTAKILSSGKAPLPRLSNIAGSNVFTRITSTNNFAAFQNKTLPIDYRLADCATMLIQSSSILHLYLQAFLKDKSLNSELTELQVYLLRLTAGAIRLIEEYVPQIPKDEKYQARMDGLSKTKSGATTTFVGAMYTVTHPEDFAAEDRHKILGAMAETLPTLKRAFSESYIAELKVSLQRSRSALKDAEDLRAVETMIKTLE